MRHNDESFTTMLLTLPLAADAAELVAPLSNQEYAQLIRRVSALGLNGIGRLIGMDVSGIMRLLDTDEQEAYRLCMLLSRTMPLSYALERFMDNNVDVLTRGNTLFPSRLSDRLGDDAPNTMYVNGSIDLLQMPFIGIFGISGVKLEEEAEKNLRTLIRGVASQGYTIITASELGVCRRAESIALSEGAQLVVVVAGEMTARANDSMYKSALSHGDVLFVSLAHPDAMYSAQNALARNKFVYAMSQAAFIVTTDGKRGETEAARKKICPKLYAFDTATPPGNRAVIARGIAPVRDVSLIDFKQYAENWKLANGEQTSFL